MHKGHFATGIEDADKHSRGEKMEGGKLMGFDGGN